MANDKPNAIKSNALGANVPEIVAALAGAIGTIVYVVNSTTGYMAGQGVDAAVVACGVVAVVALLTKAVLGGRLTGTAGGVLADVLLVGSEALLIVAFARFALARVRLAADIYFIPVNYPAAEETALNVALAGAACYLVAIVALIVKAFIARDVDRTALTLVPAEPAVA